MFPLYCNTTIVDLVSEKLKLMCKHANILLQHNYTYLNLRDKYLAKLLFKNRLLI